MCESFLVSKKIYRDYVETYVGSDLVMNRRKKQRVMIYGYHENFRCQRMPIALCLKPFLMLDVLL